MPVMRLTKRSVDNLNDRERPYVVYDDTLKGFGVRVMPSGLKSWIAEYRPGAGGRTASKRRMVLGKTTDLSADKARKLAGHMLAAVRLGGDPAKLRHEERKADKLEELIERYLSEYVDAKLKPGTAQLYRYLLHGIVVPKLGSRKARDVTRVDVERLHLAEKDRRPVIANRAVAALSGCYSWAIERGIVPQGVNPAAGVRKFREQARERYLTAEEMERLGAAIREAETVGIPWNIDEAKPTIKHLPKSSKRCTVISPHVATAIRLLLLTGARKGEILNLLWEQVDLRRGLLLLDDSKSGAKAIVLSGAAVVLLQKLPRLGRYVIAGQSEDRPRCDLKRPWKLISRRSGLEGVRIHDLRHSFASIGAGSGMGLLVLGRLLGHKQASTTQRYAHLDNDPLRRAATDIADVIAQAMEGKPLAEERLKGAAGEL
jgi:integrase